MEVSLPSHVVSRRRDGRQEIVLHRSMAVIGDDRIDLKSARSTVLLPLAGILLAAGAVTWIALSQGALPLWLMVGMLFVLLFVVPASVMGLVSALAGANVIIDAKKGSAAWQQGYLGMGIGTKDLVPFAKIDYLEVTIEGGDPDRWKEHSDDLRQFALTLVKKSGKRLTLAQVPVPAYGQNDGMDRTLAAAHAIAALTGATVRLPEGWELTEIDIATGEEVVKPVAQSPGKPKGRSRKAKGR